MAHELNLSALVEVHTTAEIQLAVAAGARIIGINNRNLNRFQCGFCNESVSCGKQFRLSVMWSLSLVFKRPHRFNTLAAAGFDAMLVGETLMRAPDKGQAVMQLRAGVRG